MTRIIVVYSEPEERYGTHRVVDAETGEWLMCGTRRPDLWVRERGFLMVPPPPDSGSRIKKVEIVKGELRTEWTSGGIIR